MLQKVGEVSQSDVGGGLATYANVFALKQNQTPNCMDVKFDIGGTVEKRLGVTTTNSTAITSNSASAFSPDNAGTLSQRIVAYWKLDEQSGNRLDSTSSANTLTDNNSTSFAAGIIGNAASFVIANSNKLDIASNPQLQTGNRDWSLVTWAYLTSNGAIQTIASKIGANGNANADREFILRYNSTTDRFELVWNVDSAGGTATATANVFGSPSTATWYMLYAFHDSGSNIIGISVNNGSVNTISATGGNSGGSNFTLGSRQDNLQYFGGRIDETGVWTLRLTSQNVTDLYNAGAANTYSTTPANQSGWGMFDFGAGFSGGIPLRHLVVAAGTGIFASSNRGVTFVAIATDRSSNYQYFERSKSYLICCSDTYNKVLYWAGSVGTFAAALAPGSAPPAKYALDFAGWLLLMNDSAGRRLVSYADNTKITTDPWTSTFEIPSSYDDEITGASILYKSAYISTKFTLHRVSSVGGNPDFSTQQVKNWGYVPRTIRRVTLPELGEVLIGLTYDKKIRIFDGFGDRIISDQIEQDNGICPFALSKIETSQIEKSFAELDTLEQVYKLWVVITPSANVTHCVCLNLRTMSWYPYQNQNINAAVMAESGPFRNLFGVTRNGFVQWIDTSNRDVATAINENYDSRFYYGKEPKSVSKSQSVSFFFQPSSSGTMIYQDRSNWNTSFGPVRDRFLLSNTSSVVQSVWTVNVNQTQNVYEFRISSSASTANRWKLTRIDERMSELGVGEA